MNDYIDLLEEAMVFTTLDADSGYRTVEIDERDREEAALTSQQRMFQFVCMLF